METLNNTKELTIIEKAREAIKNFPEKLTVNHKEIKELVEDWDDQGKYKLECVKGDQELREECEQHKPALTELKTATYKLESAIEAILKPRIKKAWEKERKDEQFRGYGEMWQLERQRWEMTKKAEQARKVAEELADLLNYQWQSKYYGYSDRIREIEKKLKTRLNRLEKNGK